MSNRELAKSLIDQIPEDKLIFVIHYLLGVSISRTQNSNTITKQETANTNIDSSCPSKRSS